MRVQPPPPIPDIERTTTVKILGVTITNNLSVSKVVNTLGPSSARARAYGMASIRRSARCNFAPADLGTFEELCRAADERLFNSIVDNKQRSTPSTAAGI